MYDNYISAILRYRWLVVLGSLLFIFVTVQGLGKIKIVSDYKSFIDPEFPPFIELEKMEEAFTENQNLMVAVVPANGDIFTAENIALVQMITDRLWLVPHVLRVDSLTNFQHTEADGDDLVVGDLFPMDEPVSDELLKRGRAFAPTEPRMVKNLVSEDMSAGVVSALFAIPDGIEAQEANTQILAAVDQILADAKALSPDTKFYKAGVVPIDHSLGKYGQQDNATLIPGMLLLMAIILLVMTRSISGVVSASGVVVFTGIGTLGLLGLKGWTIDPGSAIAPIVIMTLAVADSVHIVEGMQNAMRLGAAKMDAIAQSLRENFLPVFLTSLTTVMGVATFTFAEMPSQVRLGVTVALGVTLAFVLSVTMLPALLAILPMKTPTVRSRTTVFDKVADFSIKHFKSIVVVSVLLTLVLGSLIPLNRFNDSPSAMLAKRTPERQATEFYEENISGIIKIDVAIFADSEGGISDPEFLNRVDDFVAWARSRDNIDNVATITDTFKRLNQNMHGGDPAFYVIPESRELAAQYLLLYEMSLPYGLSLQNELTQDKSGLRMTLILSHSDSEKIVKTKWAIQQWFATNAPELNAVVTGATQLMAELSYLHMIPSMLKGGIIAILMVSLVLFFALRSLRLGILGILANMAPVVMGYGIWYLINGQVNFIVASVAGVCLGVVVDFAVHFLSKYRRERKAGYDTDTSIRKTFAKVGRPLWVTMIVLVSGFWLLMLSPVTLSFSMGYLTGIIIVLALLFDFFALPSLLKMFDRAAPLKSSAH